MNKSTFKICKYLVLLTTLAGVLYATIPVHPVASPQVTEISMEFLGKLFATCKSTASAGRQEVLKGQIARISKEAFTSQSAQEAFALMVCIESKFDSSAKSKVGAIGLTQLMPKYVQEFATTCGLGTISAKDAEDSEVNLRIGACQFNKLLQQFNGNVALALAGYNSGAFSQTTKALSKLGEGEPETMAYISKFYTLQEKMK